MAGTVANRVFCIGMNKTGTSTMKHCFEILGLSPVASPTSLGPDAMARVHRFYRDRDYEPILELAEHFRSFEDRPWNMWEMYRYLDERFPDSKFILTVRDPESWWRSTERWVTVSKPEVLHRYQLHLRVTDSNKDSMIASYLRYNREVISYFEGTDKLLSIDVASGEGWERLCPFLGLPVPDRAFPHANRQSYGPDDAAALEKKKLLKNGVLCQSCGHVTPVVKAHSSRSRRVHATPGKQAPGARLLLDRARKLLRRSKKRIRAMAGDLVERVFFALHCGWKAMHRRWGGETARVKASSDQMAATEDLAIVSCLFNPSGSHRRVSNFKAFRAGVAASGVRCLVVELAFGSQPFQLEAEEDVIHLRSSSVMWHKERLLNIAIRRLIEEGYTKIAWLDGDIQFDDPDWHRRISEELDRVNLCQVFSTVAIAGGGNACPQIGTSAVKYFLEKGRFFSQSPMHPKGLLLGRLRGGQSGFGWAARAEVFEQAMLYDRAIIGGGDKLILAASLCNDHTDSRFQSLTHSSLACEKCGHVNRSDSYTSSFLDWAKRWNTAVDGRVGYVDLHIRDMYHGHRNDRKYIARRDILYKHEFDPAQDLADDETGCLVWGSDKPDLHRDVESYFLSRREDV